MKPLFLVPMVVAMTACVPEERPAQIGMANPAAIYCAEQGGKTVSRETDIGTVSDCHLPDGTVIEEWTLYRANNP